MKTLKILLVVFTFYISYFFGQIPSIHSNAPLLQTLEEIPSQDRNQLEYFFKSIFFQEGFGYVLFGNKPMAMSSCQKIAAVHQGLDTMISALSARDRKIHAGLHIWLKYKHLFPLKSYIFICKLSPWKPLESFVLINKRNFLKKIEEYGGDFESFFQRKINESELSENPSFASLIHHEILQHEGLLGTLLGYGRNNAWAFHHKKELSFVWSKQELDLCMKPIEAGVQIFYPGFKADPSDPETELIKKEYRKAREKMINFYKGREFLKTTLMLLTAEKEIDDFSL